MGFDEIKQKLEIDTQSVQVAAEDLFKPRTRTKKVRGGVGKTEITVDIGGMDKIAHDSQLLRLEWAIKYPQLSPFEFLTEIKSYSAAQATRIITATGTLADWNQEKATVLDKMTESVVKRHIDIIAEVQETHVKASKVGLAKAIEFLSKLSIEPAKDADGKIIVDGKGKPVWKGFRSIDLLNIMSSIEKAQAIYRKAMGLPNDESGMAQILEKVSQLNIQQNHLHIHEAPGAAPKTELTMKVEKEMSYDDLLEFIEFRREQKRKQDAQGEPGQGESA